MEIQVGKKYEDRHAFIIEIDSIGDRAFSHPVKARDLTTGKIRLYRIDGSFLSSKSRHPYDLVKEYIDPEKKSTLPRAAHVWSDKSIVKPDEGKPVAVSESLQRITERLNSDLGSSMKDFLFKPVDPEAVKRITENYLLSVVKRYEIDDLNEHIQTRADVDPLKPDVVTITPTNLFTLLLFGGVRVHPRLLKGLTKWKHEETGMVYEMQPDGTPVSYRERVYFTGKINPELLNKLDE